MIKFDEVAQLNSVNGALALRSHIESIVDNICEQGYNALYFVGIGGTWASAHQVVTYLTGSGTVPVFLENAAELVTNGNPRIGKGTVVVFSSVTGSTAELIQAVELVHCAGARVFGFVDKADAPLAARVDDLISYPGNEQLKFYMVAHRFMCNRGEFSEYDRYYAQLDAHLACGLVAIEKSADSFGEVFARKHCSDTLHYFVGAGSQWGSTYSYAMCYWEEQHWLRTKSIHAAEFFHGMFEVVEKDTPVTVFVGEDKERELSLRVARFLPRICTNYTIIDAADYPIDGIDAAYRGTISHLILHAVTRRIDVHIESINCHPMEIRRYYRQLNY